MSDAVPMIVRCCLGQGCNRWPGEAMEEVIIIEWSGPTAVARHVYHESTVLDDRERQ